MILKSSTLDARLYGWRQTQCFEITCQVQCFKIRRQTQHFKIFRQTQFSVTMRQMCIMSGIV